MKNQIILVVFLLVFNSCSKQTVTIDNSGYYGKWNLVAMSGSTLNSEVTGAAMAGKNFICSMPTGHSQKREKQIR